MTRSQSPKSSSGPARWLLIKRAAWVSTTVALLIVQAQPVMAQQSVPSPTQLFAPSSKHVELPVVLCIDDKPGTGARPSSEAYEKAAKNGFRSILTLRSTKDGVDLARERFIVEQNKLRYFNIPPTAKLPRREQVDEFLTLVRDPANHPMLINCAFAERVAPYMAIFRVAEQEWTEEKAIDEAKLSGLPRDQLKRFVKTYLSGKKAGKN